MICRSRKNHSHIADPRSHSVGWCLAEGLV